MKPYPTVPASVDKEPYAEVETFVQFFDVANLTAIPEEDFFSAPFNKFCPSGDCIKDCRNMTRLFQALPDGVDADPIEYGRPSKDGANKDSMTLFGVCTNLAEAAAAVPNSNHSRELGSFFTTHSKPDANITMVNSQIASCFASTCDITREPSKCKEACAIDNFLATPNRLNFNFANNNAGSLACVSRLCDNTCGLPYADQDVLGIGVLTSYYVQAVTLILCSAAILASAGWQLWKTPGSKPQMVEKLKKPFSTFLTVQTYFGVTAAIATFAMSPSSVSPLNGYALVAVSIMGFLPPVLTLVLSHSHGIRSWFSTTLVFITYSLNSVTFFMLCRNLSAAQTRPGLLTQGLQSIFHATSCGGSSAMALCRQLTGIEPLAYLDKFFNRGPIPNINTMPAIWGWTTFVFAVVFVRQIMSSVSKDRAESHTSVLEKANNRGKVPGLTAAVSFLRRPVVSFLSLFLVVLLFGFALGYQYLVIREYQNMDVIDNDGWSFGQIVAVLFWVPPVLDIIHAAFGSEARLDAAGVAADSTPQIKPRFGLLGRPTKYFKLDGALDQRPLAHSPQPSPSPAGTRPPTLDLSLEDYSSLYGDSSLMQRWRTIGMEEGRE